ncbi:MAG: hypothetical protein FWD71_02275 [Oscillospiraceae bacterium]|nr:hypothetical protein [Oscillospiraceae bacterium]
MSKNLKLKYVERKIYFYKVTCICNGKLIKLNEIFDSYIKKFKSNTNKLSENGLLLPSLEKYYFLEAKCHVSDKNIYMGQFLSLRDTDFPYLFNIFNGNRQEISSNANDTLMELTHFICYTTQELIASEFNFYGARIETMGTYLEYIMRDIYPSQKYKIEILPIVIPEYYEKIARCKSISKLQFKVAQPGLKLLKEY